MSIFQQETLFAQILKIKSVETPSKLLDLNCSRHGGTLCTSLLTLPSLAIMSAEGLLSTMPTSLQTLLTHCTTFKTIHWITKNQCVLKEVDGGYSIDQRALKESPKIELFSNHPSHLWFWNQFLSVIHYHAVISMQANPI